MRCRKKESLKRAYYVFIALALEAMELISDCKKVYFLDAERIRNSLKKKPLHEEKKTEHCSHVLTVSLENILYCQNRQGAPKNADLFSAIDGSSLLCVRHSPGQAGFTSI